MTTALAILGVATGLTGTVLSILNFRRDRAILRLDTSTLMASDRASYVVVEVRNEGRHGITLIGLGLLVIAAGAASPRGLAERIPLFGDAARVRRVRRTGVFYNDLNTLADDTTDSDVEPFLEPGRNLRLRIPMTEAYGRAGPGMQAWPCAEDFTGESFVSSQPAHVQP